jgi:hypothetical protein
MLHVHGTAGGAGLTGTLYEPGETPPSYRGAPDDGAPYVWVCDAFYQVESGGQVQQVGDRELRVAFESPAPRGFESREEALAAAEEHVRTQFARLGVVGDSVEVTVTEADS